MTYRLIAAAAGMALALASAQQSFAQASAAAPPPISYAPAPAGVCVFDFQEMGGASLAGKAVGARLKVIGDQIRADLTTQQTQLQTDANALNQSKATLDQSTYESRAAALQVRNNALQRLAEQREQEMEQTQQNALQLLLKAADPSVRSVFQSRHCAILINRSAILFANPSTDITADVVTSLNGRVTTLNFDRATLATAPRQ